MAGTMLNMQPITSHADVQPPLVNRDGGTPRPQPPMGRQDPPRPVPPDQQPRAPKDAPAEYKPGQSDRLSNRLDNIFANLPPAGEPAPEPGATPPMAHEQPGTAPTIPSARPADAAPAGDSDFKMDLPDSVVLGTSAEPTVVTPAADEGPDAPIPAEIASNPKANHTFVELRAENKRLKAEAKALADQVLAAKTQATTTPSDEVAQIKAKNEALEARIGQLDLSQSEPFKKTYDTPIAQAMQEGIQMLVRVGQDPTAARDLIIKAARLKGDELNNLMEDLPRAVQPAVLATSTKVSTLASAREQALSKWKESRAAIDVTESRNKAAQLSQNIERDTATAIDRVVKDGNALFDKNAKGIPEEARGTWQGKVQERIDAVKGILRQAASPQGNDTDLVRYIADGVTAPELRTNLAKAVAHIRKLEGELRERNNLTPRFNGGGSTTTTPAPAKQTGPRSISDIVDSIRV